MTGLKIEGSFAVPLEVISSTATVHSGTMKVLLNNGGAAITVKMPPLADVIDGQSIVFSRMASSTGAVTINPNTGATVQALAGTVGNTTSIGAHSAAGAGLDISFTKYGAVWYRL